VLAKRLVTTGNQGQRMIGWGFRKATFDKSRIFQMLAAHLNRFENFLIDFNICEPI